MSSPLHVLSLFVQHIAILASPHHPLVKTELNNVKFSLNLVLGIEYGRFLCHNPPYDFCFAGRR